MREMPSPPIQARLLHFSSLFRRVLGRFRRGPLRRPSAGSGEAPTGSYPGASDHLGDGASRGDGDRTDPGRPWTERLLAGLARPFGRAADPDGSILGGPRDQGPDDAVLIRLQTGRDPQIQSGLILESLELLDEADAQVIRARLAVRGGESMPPGPMTDPSDLNVRYGLAVIRFSRRLAWVASQESLGMSPPQRRAVGLVKFRGISTQVAADCLRLPRDVVEYWVREEGLSSGVG